MTRAALIARDPRTYRRIVRVFPSGWDADTDPEVLSRYLEAQAIAVTRTWLHRYGLPMPTPRIVWSVQEVDNPAQLGAPA